MQIFVPVPTQEDRLQVIVSSLVIPWSGRPRSNQPLRARLSKLSSEPWLPLRVNLFGSISYCMNCPHQPIHLRCCSATTKMLSTFWLIQCSIKGLNTSKLTAIYLRQSHWWFHQTLTHPYTNATGQMSSPSPYQKPLSKTILFSLLSKMALKDISCPSWGGVL